MSVRALVAAAALAAATLLVPATASAAPTATVSGRVLDSAGKPVRGALVEFQADPQDFWFLFCLIPLGPGCRYHGASARTDANGRYRITVRTDSYLGQRGERDVNVTQPGATVPARTTLTFGWAARPVRLPDLRLWTGEVTVDPDLKAARVVRVAPLPAEFGQAPFGSLPGVSLLRHGDGETWSYGAVPHVRPTDARTVEAGTTHIVAGQRLELDGWDVWYRSQGHRVTGGVRPLSRGKSCYVYGKGGKPLRLPGCQYTDGRFATDPSLRYATAGYQRCLDCPTRDSVLLDLGSSQVVGGLAVRGCGRLDEVKGVQVSADGKTYAPLTRLPSPLDPGLYVYAPAPARYVRVDLAFGCGSSLSELSVFAPLAA